MKDGLLEESLNERNRSKGDRYSDIYKIPHSHCMILTDFPLIHYSRQNIFISAYIKSALGGKK